jgi:hypothetical protein
LAAMRRASTKHRVGAYAKTFDRVPAPAAYAIGDEAHSVFEVPRPAALA